MGKHRKNHKQKVNAFKQRQLQKKKQIEKLQEIFHKQVEAYQNTSRIEFMVETAMKSMPEMTTTNEEGMLVVNTDKIEEVEDVLRWKEDNTAVLKAFVQEDEQHMFNLETMNNILTSIKEKIDLRVMNEASKAYEEALANGTLETAFPHKETADDVVEVVAEEISSEIKE